jgi:pimeloyl-ACP methyl ester carboxylesterase
LHGSEAARHLLQGAAMRAIANRISAAIARSPAIVALVTVFVAAALAILTPPITAQGAPMSKPTVVLVHGAFAESSSWNVVTAKLLAKGYAVVAVANPLRGVKYDATYLANLLDTIDGPVILVGHSYGGNVISNIPTAKTNVKALVFVSGVAPDVGESAASLSGKFPGSTLGPTLAQPVVLADGSKDLYIRQDKYPAQFAADVPASEAKLMATTQRPITEAALNEPGGAPAWKAIPSWFLYGSLDKNIPPAVHAFMAQRAGSKKTVEVQGASHVVMMTHPDALVKLIDAASAETAQ